VPGVLVTIVLVEGVKLVIPAVSGSLMFTLGPNTVTSGPGVIVTGEPVRLGLIVTVPGPGILKGVFGSRKTLALAKGLLMTGGETVLPVVCAAVGGLNPP
jgi:hypothetical protein